MHIKTHHSNNPCAPGLTDKVVPFPLPAGGRFTGQADANNVNTDTAPRQPMLQDLEANYVGEMLTRALHRVRAAGHVSTLMVLRLCEHRELAETFGQDVGKSMMQQAAQRMHDCLRADDVFKQISDDEFAIVLGRLDSLELVSQIAQRLASDCSGDYVIDELPVLERAAIGIVSFPEDGQDYADLIRFARIALRDASSTGMPGCHFFSERRLAQKRERASMVGQLQRAVRDERLQLHYQPQYALDGKQIVGMEALLRMVSETGELIPPDRFISIAEDNGQIVEIGNWVIRQACQQLRRWHDQGHRQLRVAVNVSPHQLHDDHLVAVIDDAVARAGIDYSDLELEITEESIVENLPLVQKVLHRLSEKGVRVAVDDFGTGYSSFAYLARLPVNVIKIDRSFLVDVPSDKKASKTVAAIIAMGKELDLEVIAEGIETPAQQAFLQAADCHLGQGFVLARPEAAGVVEKLLLRTQNSVMAS